MKGIVVLTGGSRYNGGAYLIAKLAQRLGSRLPIEFWSINRTENFGAWHDLLAELGTVRYVNEGTKSDLWDQSFYRPYYCNLGFAAKPIACYLSAFDEFIYLDSDSYPLRNPEAIFRSDAYKSTGMMLWPDIQDHVIHCDIKPEDWTLYGVPAKDRIYVDSGTMVINKTKHRESLFHACTFAIHKEKYYNGPFYADKETFHIGAELAGNPFWLTTDAMKFIPDVGYLQKNELGDSVFLHRCLDKPRLPINNRRGYRTKQVNRKMAYHSDLPWEEDVHRIMGDLAKLYALFPGETV